MFSLTNPILVEQQLNMIPPSAPLQELTSIRSSVGRGRRAGNLDDLLDRLTLQGSQTRDIGCETSSWGSNDDPVETQTRYQRTDDV